jgi:hypothetical protein
MAGARDFSLFHRIQTGSGAHAASSPMGTEAFSPGLKRPEREADRSPPFSAEAKNGGDIFPLLICSYGVVHN